MPLLDNLAEFVSGLSFDSLSAQTLEKTELHVFDALGAMLAGASSEESRAISGLFKKMTPFDGEMDIPVAGFGFAAPLPQAAVITSLSARMTEIDDIHLLSCTTPGSIIVPTALSAACYAGESGKRFFESVLAGYELITRLGAAVNGPVILYRGIWPTYLFGAIGAAAVGSKIFGLSSDQIKHALAIALTMSAGLAGKIPTTGLTSRWLTLGCALQNGLTAALAAESGFAGDPAVLDGPFPSVYGLDLDTGILLDGLGEKFEIEEMSLKPFCTARQALSSIEAFRRLLSTRQIDPESVEEIKVTIPQQYSQMINHPAFPESRMPSIVSVQYQMALAAFDEEGLFDLQRKNLRDDDRIRGFIKKVHVTTSPEYTALFPRQWPGKITLKAGKNTYEQEILDPLGSPVHPMNWRDVEQKLKRVTGGILDPAQVENLGTGVRTLKSCQTLNDFIDRIPVIQQGE